MASDTADHPGFRRHVILSTLSNLGGKAITLAVWFFLTPFLVRQLGAHAYGLWILVGSVVGYGALLDLGIAPAVTKFVAQYLAEGETERASSLVATALWLYVGLGLVAILASAVLAPVFPRLFGLPADQHAMASWLVLLSGLALGIALPGATSWAVLQGLQRFDLANMIGVVGMTVYAAATVSVLLLGGGLLGMAAVNIPISLLMQIPAIWLINRAAPGLKYGRGRPRRQLVRTVISHSSALVVVHLASQVQTQTDEIVIGAYLPVAAITPYSIARRLSGLPQVLANQFVKVLMPLASGLNASVDRHNLRALYLNSTRLTLAIDLPLVCGLIVLGRALLTVWVGAEYADSAVLLAVLATASLFSLSMWPASSILQGMGRHRPLAVFAMGAALANLILSVWLVRSLGVLGVALGTLIPTVIECVFFVTPYAMRQNGVSLRAFFGEVVWPTLLPAVPALGVLVALREVLQPEGYLSIGAAGLAGAAVYGLAYWAMSRGRPERLLLDSTAARVMALVRARGRRAGRPAGKDAG